MTLYRLSETNILSITGDKAITDLNTIHVFNFLSLQGELQEEENLRMRQTNNTHRIL